MRLSALGTHSGQQVASACQHQVVPWQGGCVPWLCPSKHHLPHRCLHDPLSHPAGAGGHPPAVPGVRHRPAAAQEFHGCVERHPPGPQGCRCVLEWGRGSGDTSGARLPPTHPVHIPAPAGLLKRAAGLLPSIHSHTKQPHGHSFTGSVMGNSCLETWDRGRGQGPLDRAPGAKASSLWLCLPSPSFPLFPASPLPIRLTSHLVWL